MKVFNGVVELEQAVGDHLGHSAWHTLTQGQIDAFAEATGDHQWIHVDREAASSGPFGTTVAHGFLTLSLVPMLTWQVYAIEGVQAGLNYGVNMVRFPSPVPAGSRVRAGVALLAVSRHPMGHKVATRVIIERQGADKPASVVDMLTIVVP